MRPRSIPLFLLLVAPAHAQLGSGADGAITINQAKNLNTDILANGRTKPDGEAFKVAALGGSTVTVAGTGTGGTIASQVGTSIAAGNTVLLINLRGDAASSGSVGQFEMLTVLSVAGATVTLTTALTKSYGVGGNADLTGQSVVLQRVPNYTDVTIADNGVLTTNAFDGLVGGVVAFQANGTVQVAGMIDVSGKGYRGGLPGVQGDDFGQQGESPKGSGGRATAASLNGGGGGKSAGGAAGGGGGGYGTIGTGGGSAQGISGVGGGVAGDANLTQILFGGGGGGGGDDNRDFQFCNQQVCSPPWQGYPGGAGGGILLLAADAFNISNGFIRSLGANGVSGPSAFGEDGGAGGGGSGGSILLYANTVDTPVNRINAKGGAGGTTDGGGGAGGAGGVGRIAILTSGTISGATYPPFTKVSPLKANGSSCAQGSECQTGNCVDKVCCNTLCGGGKSNDCQACSIAAGAAVNGLCGALSTQAAPTVTCRPAVDLCDTPETCAPDNVACPNDTFKAMGTVCRPASDGCDLQEKCDGLGSACPKDDVVTTGTLCRAAFDSCDAEESCDGSSPVCPKDLVKPSTTVCRTASGVCDAEEKCDGINTACPADAVKPAIVLCRAADGVCDSAERCDGKSKSCPEDEVLPSTTVCRVKSGECDIEELCDGTAKVCPADQNKPSGAACSAGLCRNNGTCVPVVAPSNPDPFNASGGCALRGRSSPNWLGLGLLALLLFRRQATSESLGRVRPPAPR